MSARSSLVDPQDLLQPIAWGKCADYERTEVIEELLTAFRKPPLCRDAVWIEERHALLCTSALTAPCVTDAVQLAGQASLHHEALYRSILQRARKKVLDFNDQIKFLVRSGDKIPPVVLTELHPSCELRAKRHWQQAMWAMRCGTVSKIGEAREIAARTLAFSTARGDRQQKKKKNWAPTAKYQHTLTSKTIDLPRLAVNVPTLFVVWASWDEDSLQFLRDVVFCDADGQHCDDRWVDLCAQYLPLRSLTSPVAAGDSAEENNKSNRRKNFRVADIVLISIDRSSQDAVVRLGDIMRRCCGAPSSEKVALHSLWAGEEGLQSPLASQFGISALPFAFTGVPMELRGADCRGLQLPWIVPPRVGTIGLVANKQTDTSSSRNQQSMKWHDAPAAKRCEVETAVCAAIRGSDAPMAFRSETWTEHRPLNGPGGKDRRDESMVSLRGTCSSSFITAVAPHVEYLRWSISNCELSVVEIIPSAPIVVPINVRTAEHRLKGWVADVHCCSCRTRIHLDKQPSYFCLQCHGTSAKCCFCEACGAVGAAKHPPHHTLAKLHFHVDPKIPVLWGPSNVFPLPTLGGKLAESVSRYHLGIFCNACMTPIRGVRWKCLMCCDADLCETCEESWFSNVRQRVNDVRHPTDHIMARIPCAVPFDSSSFLVSQTIHHVV